MRGGLCFGSSNARKAPYILKDFLFTYQQGTWGDMGVLFFALFCCGLKKKVKTVFQFLFCVVSGIVEGYWLGKTIILLLFC